MPDLPVDSLKRERVLFIGPIFYEYHLRIKEKMEEMGNTVSFFPERRYDLLYSLVNNFRNSRLARLQAEYYRDIEARIAALEFDVIFVIRGFLMPASFIQRLRSRFPQARFIMYQWDSMANYDFSRFWGLFDKMYSFDPQDCQRFPALEYLPNFFLEEYAGLATETSVEHPYDLSFIGAIYDDRPDILRKIREQLRPGRFFEYGYISGQAFFKRYLLRGKVPKRFKMSTITGNQVLNTVRMSKAVLDIQSAKQSGYPYRVIDALVAGRKVITTNAFIAGEDFYDPKNILVIDREKPILDLDFLASDFHAKDLEKYSLRSWLARML